MGTYAGFNSVQLRKPQRSAFDLSETKRLTMRMGQLYPVLIKEAVPSDSFRGSTELLLRLAPLLAPIYDQIILFVHFFFVPNRLLWEDWEQFITGGRMGVGVDPVSAPVPPYYDIGDVMAASATWWAKSSLADYLGCPIFGAIDSNAANWNGKHVDAMPFLAYQLIWYEYYRDRNFVGDSFLSFPLESGEMINAIWLEYLVQRTRYYEADYFTSALPFTQRGEEVLMPVSLGGTAPIYADPVGSETSATVSGIGQPGSVSVGYGITIDAEAAHDGDLYVKGEDFDGTTTSINDFRSAYALQVWLERNAIGGSRYTESTQAHFGVKPQDSRLQRPEYIGGGRINVKISEIVSTSWSNDGTSDVPLANMAGHGITYGNTNQFRYFCTEHGFIMGIASIMNPPSYHQGLPRMFQRRSFLDYPWPTFAKLGEQQVNNHEIYCTPASLTLDANGEFPLFGYQSRYSDWKYSCNTNHGDFHDDLLFWSLTRTFTTAPVLSHTFNAFDDTTQDRIFAVGGPTVDNFWVYCHNRVDVKRPLPYFGTPNTLGFGS